MALQQLNNYAKFFSFILKYYNSDVVKSTANSVLNEIEKTEISEDEYNQKPEELVEDLKKMGPTYVKLGQLLSTRPDLLPENYLQALANLQDDVETVPYEEVQKIFEEEIGVKINKAFELFDPKPLASASIGQVHLALLPSGRKVVVKIQRPGVRKKFIEELETLKNMADLAVTHSKVAKKYALDDVIEELRFILLNELDYNKEAQNLVILKENLKEFKNLIVPSPVAEYSSSKVLTMDFIDGKKITSLGNLKKIETDFTSVIDDLVEAYMKQIIVDGFVHADPHPGNIHVTADDKVALMDLGMVAKFSPKLQEKIMMLLVGMTKKDGDDITDALLEISEYDSAKVNLDHFRKNINRLVMDSTSTNAEDMETGRILLQMNRIAADEGIKLAVELNILGKVLLNMDQIVAVLTPKYDLQKAIRRFMEKMVNKKMQQEHKPENAYAFLLDNKKLLENLPGRLNKITENLANNQLELKINAIDEDRLTEGFQKVANRITSGLIIAAMIIGAALLMRIPSTYTILGYGVLPFFFFVIAIGLGLFLVYSIMFKDDHFKKSS
ncbi:AarF/ABC1/UbiB kinase family protein [Candidatus Kaistella beijingensis]|uniref:ABC1 kinase family protein n=1 Tax=Candidatus Kaistella beijingensis TaxID=2820270 RepID=UPI001CC4C2A3|nr:AarF/UbiB family protein [Candidatus Kaistella beijingensis]UBB89736.1 AarF/ABC1/UbiB kinase family protein [Candidatus Kaistella beijingensis]